MPHKIEKKRWGSYKDKRNWQEYNERLVKRGEMYLSLNFLETWEKEVEGLNRSKVGSPYEYPDSLITFLGFVHMMLGIDYRGLQGFVRGLKRLVNITAPHYSTIDRRVNALKLGIQDTLIEHRNEDVVISLDSSGVKVSNRGEWIRKKWRVKRGWIKVHIAVDKRKKQCVGIEVTDESTGDSKKFMPLVKEAKQNIEGKGGRISQANADGAYDTRDNFNALKEMRITPGIKVRKNASARARGCPLRKKHVREYKQLGYDRWRDKYRYGYRWDAEGNLSAVKRLTGEYVMATKKDNMYREVAMKFLFYNSILKFDATEELPWSGQKEKF